MNYSANIFIIFGIEEEQIDLVNSYTTTVRMLPVCECGQIIDDLMLEVYIDEIEFEPGYKYSKYSFHPAKCPNCRKYIDCLQVDGKYTDMFKKEKT